jgi:hypothetical protein
MPVAPRAVVLYDANDTMLSVSDGAAIPAGTDGLLWAGKDKSGNARQFAASPQNVLCTSPLELAYGEGAISSGRAGQWIQVITTGTSWRPDAVAADVTNAQRSIVSGSANDTSAGTGVRTVRITYISFNGTTMTGPFTEDITMNGTTFVNTSSSTIAYIERLDALTVGSGGVAAGAIDIRNAGGAGSIHATMNLGEVVTTNLALYVPSATVCFIREFTISSSLANTSFPNFQLSYDVFPGSFIAGPINVGVKRPILKELRIQGSQSAAFFRFQHPPKITGPALIGWFDKSGLGGTNRIMTNYIQVPV